MKPKATPDVRLERVRSALEQELLDASDAEVLAVVTELGLLPEMQGSAALVGVTRLLFQTESADARAPTERSAGARDLPSNKRRRPRP